MTWTRHQLNDILDLGDEMYRTIPHIHKYVDYTELPWLFCISQYNAISESEATVILNGYLGSKESAGHLYSLEDAATSATVATSTFLLTTCGFTVAVMKVKDSLFFMDSHSSDAAGLQHPDGVAVLLKFSSVHALARHIRRLYRSSLQAQFDIVAFRLRRLARPGVKSVETHPMKLMKVNLPNGKIAYIQIK